MRKLLRRWQAFNNVTKYNKKIRIMLQKALNNPGIMLQY